MRINKADIQEILCYKWRCPECEIDNYDTEDPDGTEYYYCMHCGMDIELQDE